MAIVRAEPPYQIESLAIVDLEAVIEIERASGLTPSTPQAILEEMSRDGAFIDVVREGPRGGVMAFGDSWIVADEVHLLNLATLPGARRTGHGTRLLAHIIARGRARGCRLVTLEVRRSNAEALRLYRRFDFKAVGIRPAYYAQNEEDAIVMLLDLT